MNLSITLIVFATLLSCSTLTSANSELRSLRGGGQGAGTKRNIQLAKKKKQQERRGEGRKRPNKKKPGRNQVNKQQSTQRPANKKKPGNKKKDKPDNNKPNRPRPNKTDPSKNNKPNKQNKPNNQNNNKPALPSRDYQSRIIGGTEAPRSKYSYAVSFQDSIGHFCGGSLITRNAVLTAAHCQGGRYNAVIGRHDLDSNAGQSIGVDRERPYDKYDDRSTDGDFMVVFLSKPAVLGNDVSLVTLNSNNAIPNRGVGVTVMGWGDVDIRDDVSNLSDVLMNVKVETMDNDDCDDSSGHINGYSDNYHGQITSNMLCAKANRQDSCQGDSGGPLVLSNGNKDVQVGVVSWGIGCASEDFPGVYARVSRAYKWIEEEVCDNNKQYAEEAGFDCGSGSGGGGGGGSGGGGGGGGSASSIQAPSPSPPSSNFQPSPKPPNNNPPSKPNPSPKPPNNPPSKPNPSPSNYAWDDDWFGNNDFGFSSPTKPNPPSPKPPNKPPSKPNPPSPRPPNKPPSKPNPSPSYKPLWDDDWFGNNDYGFSSPSKPNPPSPRPPNKPPSKPNPSPSKPNNKPPSKPNSSPSKPNPSPSNYDWDVGSSSSISGGNDDWDDDFKGWDDDWWGVDDW